MIAALLLATSLAEPPVVTVDADDIQITESCTLRFVDTPIADANGDGVVHIRGDDLVITVEPGTRLRGAAPDARPDTYTGTGIHITGRNIALRNARVSGFKVGIHAVEADGFMLSDADVTDNFRQRLRSTPRAEDATDWLRPHENDNHEWITRYGAGVCLERSNEAQIERLRARDVQNGIILDRVDDTVLVDNDCSFLSGWGIALWRSSNNIIVRNALDFCVRGYSHGVYNRGQDSAGLLLFEQCNGNVIAQNSATHGGDGFFCFAGREALGEVPPPDDIDLEKTPYWYRGRGHSRNVMLENDCSYAAAHGIELTFSFDNMIVANRLVGNAICGIWGGYSHRTIIGGNTIEQNGEMPYGLERGGINIEHGRGNAIRDNVFRGNACDIHLWWDSDVGLASLPWSQVQNTRSDRNLILDNEFNGPGFAVQLRECDETLVIDNTFGLDSAGIDADEASRPGLAREWMHPQQNWRPVQYDPPGVTTPVGARAHLAGRQHIVMTEWGPWDHESPLLRAVQVGPGLAQHEYELLGTSEPATITGADGIVTTVLATTDPNRQRLLLIAPPGRGAHPYQVTVRAGDHSTEIRGVFVSAKWQVTVFPSPNDPREDVEAWRAAALAFGALRKWMTTVDLDYAHAGPGAIGFQPAVESVPPIPSDHFGTVATTTMRLPIGRWRLRTRSDDGIRVWMDDDVVIDDWSWHPPRTHTYDFVIVEPREIDFRVEHFELDGYATLSVELEFLRPIAGLGD